MIRKTTEAKITKAFNLLAKHGIHMCVPGWFDLRDAKEAVEFARDPQKYYASKD